MHLLFIWYLILPNVYCICCNYSFFFSGTFILLNNIAKLLLFYLSELSIIYWLLCIWEVKSTYVPYIPFTSFSPPLDCFDTLLFLCYQSSAACQKSYSCFDLLLYLNGFNALPIIFFIAIFLPSSLWGWNLLPRTFYK